MPQPRRYSPADILLIVDGRTGIWLRGYGSLPVEQFKIAEIAVEITLTRLANGDLRLT
ncbi:MULTISPECIES: hypothetical protein [Paraburkholderia]|uniref:hypothetical protein n=1 Tax=Paraburkholderia TaxID=1822464 RepID=UPI0022534DF9|nr:MULTISPECIES: hypothetical protein [Paraburkholderia]MCX4174151.1 hypothetical protein [Paraburkholderia madseniana]MDQ6462154.1 hypothetical protein [Paraburkholderia madseniana]